MIRKKPKKATPIYPSKIGEKRIEELLAEIADNRTNFPPSISLSDLDLAMMAVFKENNNEKGSLVCVSPENKKTLPIFSLEAERWALFHNTWKIQDNKGVPQKPFLTIKRDGAPQKGTHPTLRANIPQGVFFTYKRNYNWDGVNLSIDEYQIPQPTPIDVNYEIRIYSNSILDINKMDELMQINFDSIQAYVNVKGYFMPYILETVERNDTLNEKDTERYYCNIYKLKLIGFLQDETQFRKIEGIKTINTNLKIKGNNDK